MTDFAEAFNEAPDDEKVDLFKNEQNRRMSTDRDKYIPLPVVIPSPRRSRLAIAGDQPQLDVALGWIVGLPASGSDDESREAVTIVFPSEEGALDLCYALNQGRECRLADTPDDCSDDDSAAATTEDKPAVTVEDGKPLSLYSGDSNP